MGLVSKLEETRFNYHREPKQQLFVTRKWRIPAQGRAGTCPLHDTKHKTLEVFRKNHGKVCLHADSIGGEGVSSIRVGNRGVLFGLSDLRLPEQRHKAADIKIATIKGI